LKSQFIYRNISKTLFSRMTFLLVLITVGCNGKASNSLDSQTFDQGNVTMLLIPVSELIPATPEVRDQGNVVQRFQSDSGNQTPICTTPSILTPAAQKTSNSETNPTGQNSVNNSELTRSQLILTGYVLDINCEPVANTQLDFWQINAQGFYDLDGKQFTDANGHYQLKTDIFQQSQAQPGYIYVNIHPPVGPLLTTRIFFPDATNNASLLSPDPLLVINVVSDGKNMLGTYDFIIRTQ
jgi:hypothetical protein